MQATLCDGNLTKIKKNPTHHQRSAVHALGRRCETSHNKLMRSSSIVVIAQVALRARKAQIPGDTVPVIKRVVRQRSADDRMVVVDRLRWRRGRTGDGSRDTRTGTRHRLFRMIRMRTHHRNSHLRSAYRHVVVDVVGARRRRGLLQEVLQV